MPNPRRLLVAYAFLLGLPLVAIAAISRAEVLSWLRTGVCPGGPMDRPSAPCGPWTFSLIVLLGGWSAFIIVPALTAWWFAATLWFLEQRDGRCRGPQKGL